MLATPWVFSWQPYGAWEMNDYVVISSVEAFWIVFDKHIPKPSFAFRTMDDYRRPKFANEVDRIRSLCLRRQSIAELEWEDPANKGCYTGNITNITSEKIDTVWETLLLLTIGETLEASVRAVRIIDRGKKQSVDTRFEVWCDKECITVKQELEKEFNSLFSWTFFN